ncbi:MAG: hypothetical protein A2029_17190 [Chloroflexi bacterium RBG_19FT_COMBO_47_9]|nr:MAG: hypothetical protein A2029_17190 [Chloroflexi bacterium RBG_19FT_COMBO_47_9]
MNILVNDFIITLAGKGIGEIPNGLLLDSELDYKMNQFGVQPGMLVECNGRQIEIKPAKIRVDFSQAIVFPVRRSIDSPLLSRNEIGEKLIEANSYGKLLAPAEGLGPLWSHTSEILQNRIDLSGFKSPIVRAAVPPILNLLSGIRGSNTRLVTESVHSLTGLGIGLTPSGDDVLTGLLAAIVLVSTAVGNQKGYHSMIESIVSSATGRSNTLSFTYLRQAAKGELTNTLSSYISALVSQGDHSVEEVTRRLFSYGATSGSELALGAYLGIAHFMFLIDD